MAYLKYGSLESILERLGGKGHKGRKPTVQLGPRPFFLVNDMDEGPLKETLQSCEDVVAFAVVSLAPDRSSTRTRV